MQLPSIALPRWKLVAVIVIVSTGVAMLGGAAGLGNVLAPVSIILGWFILAPLVALLGSELPMIESPEDGTETDEATVIDPAESTVDPVDRLRERYARGELTDSEFERRLDRLLETESLSANDESEDEARATDRELSLETE
ncbi:SHOCT domain-containing protein [Haloarcula sp. S1AR25-5A]|uniref:SHOCT domain-containing protein n=1 Tax=Haloarcula terrestris TaxID=2950533 RepID=A0AAE4EX91_9EURY|nr:SHOCT domain-containing protein [Haloarcula terrestris]MDS0221861.1 SHOCT domain-containing protein [Haloarcula terrestris]